MFKHLKIDDFFPNEMESLLLLQQQVCMLTSQVSSMT